MDAMEERKRQRELEKQRLQELLSAYRGVWVFIEQQQGKILPVSLELLGAGRKLADKLGVELAGVLIGDQVGDLPKTAFAYGADVMYVMDQPIFSHYRSETFMKAFVYLAEKYKPEIVLFGATVNGKDLASAVATDLKTGLTADTTVLDVDVEERLLEASRPAFGGNIMATILCKTERPQMATVRPRVLKAPEPDFTRTGRVVEEFLDIHEEEIKTKVIEVVKDLNKKVNLEEADIIVAGGKGLGDEKGFQLVHQLAEVLGASVGASRDVVEAGWISHAHQIGQTGVTVTPKIYIAIGISGAVQHIVGCQNSGMIIAINKDPNAPIFDIATYGIVGDAFEIVPKMIEEIRARMRGEVQYA
jgi:electron transfer flavoprotein alpha subunit